MIRKGRRESSVMPPLYCARLRIPLYRMPEVLSLSLDFDNKNKLAFVN